MVFCVEHQLELPDKFPVDAFVAFMATAREVTHTPTKSAAWAELAGASNLIGWRFMACHEDLRTFVESWRTKSPASFEGIYLRDRALFGMFTAGVSCVESTCYALHALASHPSVLGVPFSESEQRASSPRRLRQVLSDYSRGKALSVALDALLDSPEWKTWLELRNRMSHRSNLPRNVYGMSGDVPPPAKALQYAATSSSAALTGEIEDLEALFTWLTDAIRELLVAGSALASTS
jgi:hypothetical protein